MGITTCTPAPGSSPLTRGKRELNFRAGLAERLIPAHAGKTRTARTPRRPGRAHPRSCGENTRKMGLAAMVAGSSPLMRGKPRLRRPHRRQDGLIPAHAGKTQVCPFHAALMPAHPRSRGENVPGWLNRGRAPGSSPLTRGKLNQLTNRIKPRGLIPAHAGKTVRGRRAMPAGGAHPRSRGENPVLHFTAVCRVGSSPLTRGKRTTCRSVRMSRGLIPAHAGKT